MTIACVIGCDGDPARIALVPVEGNACGRPAGGRNIRVTAYAASGERTRAVAIDETVDLADFPGDTEQLGIEVEVGGGLTGAVGKTAPIADFADLDEGTQLHVFMAPPAGFCPTVGAMETPRIAPLVARAGAGVLIIGGQAEGGAQLVTAEFYDPASSTFTPVVVPEVLGENGFAGSSAATLLDGRVAISGGPRPVITLFDADTMTFGESVLIESRSFHTSVAIDATHVLVAGGCSEVTSGTCVQRKSSKIYDTDKLGMATVGPNLRVARVGAQIFDLGDDSFIVAGGTSLGAPDGADYLSLGRADAIAISAARGQAAQLDGGAVLTAFEPDGVADGTASVIVPGIAAARAIAKAPDRDGVRLIGAEDGHVIGIGGDTEVLTYDPTLDRWDSEAPAGTPPTGLVTAPSLTRLADGSILVLGGRVDGAASAQAWIYRPSLVGPSTGSIVVDPGSTSTVLTPVDPATVMRVPDWELTADGNLARALVGGPRMVSGSVLATLRVRTGGVALVAQQSGPGRALIAELAPMQAARIVRSAPTGDQVVCTGKVVPAFGADTPTTVRFAVDGETLRLVLDGETLATCMVDIIERGAWGVAALPGSRVTVDTVTVAR